MGALSSFTAPQLGALVIREVVQRANLTPDEIDEVIMGQVVQAGTGQNPRARVLSAQGCRPRSPL